MVFVVLKFVSSVFLCVWVMGRILWCSVRFVVVSCVFWWWCLLLCMVIRSCLVISDNDWLIEFLLSLIEFVMVIIFDQGLIVRWYRMCYLIMLIWNFCRYFCDVFVFRWLEK